MSQKYLIRIAELERLLSEQAEALRQKDQQLSLVEETEAFLRSALARAEEKIEEDEREIEHLRAQIEKLRRMLFGTRSEKLRREVEQAEALLKQREQESDRYSGREDDPLVPRQLRQSRHRRPLPAHLPREIYRLEPEESCCPECGGELDYLGEVSAEQLELVSSALKVIRTERVKKACTKCDCIVEAPAPSRPIERGIAGPGLLARVLTGKYCAFKPAGHIQKSGERVSFQFAVHRHRTCQLIKSMSIPFTADDSAIGTPAKSKNNPVRPELSETSLVRISFCSPSNAFSRLDLPTPDWPAKMLMRANNAIVIKQYNL